MIFPNKNTDPNLSVINAMCFILEFLMNSGQSTITELKNYIATEISEDVLPLFEPAIDVLFLLGKIEYDSRLDAVYLTYQKRTA